MLISTDKFLAACQSMAKIGGIPDIQWAVVPHPLGSCPDDILMERARSAVEQFERIVCGLGVARGNAARQGG